MRIRSGIYLYGSRADNWPFDPDDIGILKDHPPLRWQFDWQDQVFHRKSGHWQSRIVAHGWHLVKA